MNQAYTELDIKLDGFGKPMIARYNKTLRVTCVDGNNYIRTYKTWQDARSNLTLVTIAGELGWVKA